MLCENNSSEQRNHRFGENANRIDVSESDGGDRRNLCGLDAWIDLQVCLLRLSTCLFVGVSCLDFEQVVLVIKRGNMCYPMKQRHCDRWIGVFDNAVEKLKIRKMARIKEVFHAKNGVSTLYYVEAICIVYHLLCWCMRG